MAVVWDSWMLASFDKGAAVMREKKEVKTTEAVKRKVMIFILVSCSEDGSRG